MLEIFFQITLAYERGKMDIKLLSQKDSSKNQIKSNEAALFFIHSKNEKVLKKLPQFVKKSIQERFFKQHEEQGLFLPYTASQNTKHTILIGLKDETHTSLRQACGFAYKILNANKFQSVQIDLSLAPFTQNHENIRALAEGFILSSYSFDECKQKKANSKEILSQIILYGDPSFVSKFKGNKKTLFSIPLMKPKCCLKQLILPAS